MSSSYSRAGTLAPRSHSGPSDPTPPPPLPTAVMHHRVPCAPPRLPPPTNPRSDTRGQPLVVVGGGGHFQMSTHDALAGPLRGRTGGVLMRTANVSVSLSLPDDSTLPPSSPPSIHLSLGAPLSVPYFSLSLSVSPSSSVSLGLSPSPSL